jgi:hypothetical protein
MLTTEDRTVIIALIELGHHLSALDDTRTDRTPHVESCHTVFVITLDARTLVFGFTFAERANKVELVCFDCPFDSSGIFEGLRTAHSWALVLNQREPHSVHVVNAHDVEPMS